MAHDARYPECSYRHFTRVGHVDVEVQAQVSCSWCRRETRRDREKVRRRPSLPLPAKGTRSLCGEVLGPRRRAWCSDLCGHLWMAAANQSLFLGHLTALHGWACWGCGESQSWDGRLDVDHVKPLWALTDEERLEPRWWLPFNLQLLCPDCHKAKTKWEAGCRARGVWTTWAGVAAQEPLFA